MREAARDLKGTFLGVALVLLVVLAIMVGVLAGRPSSALAVPHGYRTVNVKLVDYAITGPTTLPAGKYEFVLKNVGRVPHELVIWRTKTSAAALPLAKDGRVDEESDTLEGVLDSGSSLDPGETRILFADLTTAGHYALVCNLPAHYHSGMHLDLAVS